MRQSVRSISGSAHAAEFLVPTFFINFAKTFGTIPLLTAQPEALMHEMKTPSAFRFTCESGEKADVEGRDIAFRPHERPKKV